MADSASTTGAPEIPGQRSTAFDSGSPVEGKSSIPLPKSGRPDLPSPGLNDGQSRDARARREPATIDWRDEIDGAGGLYDLATTARNQLHYLVCDLEFSLNPDRGTVDKGIRGVTLHFQAENLDATLWLVSRAWSTCTEIVERLQTIQRRLYEVAE
jgi:hypothetical protein